MQVSGAFVGMIIGRGGENVKSMSRESGAKIEVSRDDGDRDADRNVTITGTAESIEKAMKLIEDVIGNRAGGLDDRSDAESLPEPPPGFEASQHEEWLFNAKTQEFFNKTTGALAWLNASTGLFCPIREGVRHGDLQLISGTAVGIANSEAKDAPKTVVIPDLHRVAQALKAPFDHVDMPASMIAVFASPADGVPGVPVDQAARTFHEKLVRRIASWRSAWLDQAWFGALTGAMMDVAGERGVLPVVAAALLIGRKVVATSAPGARVCLMAGAASDACTAVAPMEMDGFVCCFQQLPPQSPDVADTADTLCIPVALLAGLSPLSTLDDGVTCTAVSRHLDRQGAWPNVAHSRLQAVAAQCGAVAPWALGESWCELRSLFQNRPRAAAVALLRAARQAPPK
ncbi:Khsrp [Symbiodinium natans]|uniref:Khsrp protein n=1 Tax=Symbiodinium natans TaxID=878477 RepID=A0A812LEX5_9DINO|nr:Khsrp [Symbiodinium natans]